MCSNSGGAGGAAGSAGGPGSTHAPTIAGELHGLLDRLLAADLSGLSSEEHAVLVQRVVRAEQRLHAGVLDAVGAFDAADAVAVSPQRTTKRWLQENTRLSAGAASGLARTARAVRDHLPATRDALAEGAVSAQHVAAIVGVVDMIGAGHAVSAEPILLDLARRCDPGAVRAAAARIHEALDPAGAEAALHAAYAKRGVRLSVGGRYGYLHGVFDLESTEVLQSALMPLMARAGEHDERSIVQRRADALIDVAKRALDTGLESSLGGERAHVSIVIDEDALRSGAGSATVAWTDGAWTASTVRRWTCDAQLTPVLATLLPPPGQPTGGGAGSPAASPAAIAIGGGWLPLDVGRAARTVTTAQTKALRVRDGGCVHPGCTRTAAFCDAHHVQHWADGGATSLANLVLLCRHHHRTLHTGHWSLTPDTGQPGRFWASSAGWATPAQTAADRSPPIQIDPATIATARDPARSLWQ